VPPKPKTIDEYLAALDDRQRPPLEKLRQTIKKTAPNAEESISYGLAAFRQNGMLVGFGATPHHLGFYLMSATTLDNYQKELKGYDLSKGTIRFQPEKPLPASLVRKLVRVRLAENEAALKKKAKKSPAKSSKTATAGAKAKTRRAADTRPTAIDAEAVVDKLKRLGSDKVRDGMARYAIPSDNAFGVSVGTLQKLAKQLGRSHELAAALWDTGWYEARMLATFLDEPERVTPAQMDGWCRDFDSWAICDTACFHLFDRTPYAFAKVEQWAKRREEFVKRGAFALLASLALHDKRTGDEPFRRCFPLIEKAATDDRNFVKKGVSWALRGIGRRPTLKQAAIDLAEKLSASSNPAARWIGNDALRDLTRKR
jgi:3-methyladenine DNA glycosylase AlkD/uncharacterized protein YdhG (YjbR/CyaY superfamily)